MKLGDLRLSDLMRLLRADDAPAPEYRPEDPPALPEAYQRLSVQDCRIRLRELQREAAQRCANGRRSEEHTSELQSPCNLVCRLLLEKKKMRHLFAASRLSTVARALCPEILT